MPWFARNRGMAHNQGGTTLGNIIIGFVAILFLAGWGLYELCCSIAEAIE